MRSPWTRLLLLTLTLYRPLRAYAADELIVASDRQSSATIIVSPQAGKWEKQAAGDLQKYVAQMTGAKPALSETAPAGGPLLFIGQAALAAEPTLRAAL